MPSKNIADWGAVSVRSAIFTTAFDATRVDEIYLRAFGQQPSGYQGAPAGFPNSPSQASGVDKHGQLLLQKQPGRLDFLITPSEPPRTGTTLTLKDHISSLDAVQSAAVKIAGEQERISRVALIAEFASSMGSLARISQTAS